MQSTAHRGEGVAEGGREERMADAGPDVHEAGVLGETVPRDQRRIVHVFPPKTVEPIALAQELTLKCSATVSRMPR